MKLFAWQPNGQGPSSFFVMAEDEAAARVAVDRTIAKNQPPDGYIDHRCWPGNYTLTIAEAGVVILNPND